MTRWASSGGADHDEGVTVVLTTILGRSLCVDCVAKKSGLPVPRVDAMLATIAGNLTLSAQSGRCDGCLQSKPTFRLDSDAAGPPLDTTTGRRVTQHAILRFLRDHAGKVFCADCISTRVLGGKNIDVAMRHLEGNGVARRHASCAGCGKRRLTAGLPSS